MNLTIPGPGRPSVSVGHASLRSHLKTHLPPARVPCFLHCYQMLQNNFGSYPSWFHFLYRLRTQNRNRSQWKLSASEGLLCSPSSVFPHSHLPSRGQALSSARLGVSFLFSLLLGFGGSDSFLVITLINQTT